MPNLHVNHVIFTRVERAYSPNRYNGYQIVYQSPSLGEETAQIEKRIQCFSTNGQQIDRYQFFWTEKGQAVIAKSVALLNPDRDVIDRDQRDAFLAHAIVLSKEEFILVKNDPFTVFEAAEADGLFAEDVQKLVTYLRQVPPREQIHVPIRKQVHHPPEGWSNEELLKLYMLGQRAAAMTNQKQSFLVSADNTNEVVSLLSVMFMLLVPDERPACTFDTFIDNCAPPAGTFWLVGGSRHLSNAGFVPIRLIGRKMDIKREGDDLPDPKVTAYSAWLQYSLRHYPVLSEVNKELYSAQVIAEAFTIKKALPDEPLNENALVTFKAVNKQSITNNLRRALVALLEKRIAEGIADFINQHLPLQDLLSIAAQERCDPQTLAELTYHWILNEQPAFRQWDDILPFAKQAEHAPLLLLASAKARFRLPFSHDDRIRSQAIDALVTSGRLPEVLCELWGMWLVPASFVTARSAIAVINYAHPDQLNDEEFHALVEALLRHGAGDKLGDAYVQRVIMLQDSNDILSLARAVKQTASVAPAFIQALQGRLASIPSQKQRRWLWRTS